MGQAAAKRYLLRRGYKILAENYRLRSSEIDIIALDSEYVVFVEVKLRSSLAYGLPREAVNAAKQRRIVSAAMHYIGARELREQDFRFDVVEVVRQGGQLQVSHIPDAFQLN